jgi:calcineurin-like phosphoesterase family protein
MKFLFYKPIKITDHDTNIVFWSDTHFGHRCEHWASPLWKNRGFNSSEEHDYELIKRWNKVSTPDTTFIHLGDFIFGQDTVPRMESILKQVMFKTLYLLPGNHCSGWKQHFEFQHSNIWQLEEKRVIFLPNYVETYVNRQPIVLSHFPIASWNGQGKGSWMLHGHCHGNLYKSEIGELLYKTKTIDIGIENCPNPLTFKDLQSKFKNKPTHTYDHHNSQTSNPF